MTATIPERVLPPTARQVQALRAYVHAGDHVAAARELEIAPRTLKLHLAALRLRIGVRTNAQAVAGLWLGYHEHLADCTLSTHSECAPRMPGLEQS